MIGGTPHIPENENKEKENNQEENLKSEKKEEKLNNDNFEEKKEEKPKKKSNFSFIKKKGSPKSTTNLSDTSINNDINKNNKSTTNDEDLSKLMKATSTQNSNAFESLNKVSTIPNNSINKDISSNPKENNIPKPKIGFVFIKKWESNSSKNLKLEENISQPPKEKVNNKSKETEIEKPKKKNRKYIEFI